jgi:hypothetical protein
MAVAPSQVMTRDGHFTTGGAVMWNDTAWSCVFIVLVLFGFAFGH